MHEMLNYGSINWDLSTLGTFKTLLQKSQKMFIASRVQINWLTHLGCYQLTMIDFFQCKNDVNRSKLTKMFSKQLEMQSFSVAQFRQLIWLVFIRNGNSQSIISFPAGLWDTQSLSFKVNSCCEQNHPIIPSKTSIFSSFLHHF